jgi:hypothetical protein
MLGKLATAAVAAHLLLGLIYHCHYRLFTLFKIRSHVFSLEFEIVAVSLDRIAHAIAQCR